MISAFLCLFVTLLTTCTRQQRPGIKPSDSAHDLAATWRSSTTLQSTACWTRCGSNTALMDTVALEASGWMVLITCKKVPGCVNQSTRHVRTWIGLILNQTTLEVSRTVKISTGKQTAWTTIPAVAYCQRCVNSNVKRKIAWWTPYPARLNNGHFRME